MSERPLTTPEAGKSAKAWKNQKPHISLQRLDVLQLYTNPSEIYLQHKTQEMCRSLRLHRRTGEFLEENVK